MTTWSVRTYKKNVYYESARKHADQIGKPLLVIGNPDGGHTDQVFGASHGGGDICVDITDRPTNKTKNYKCKAHELLRTIPSNSCVVYSSMVLEYVGKKDLDETVKHLLRVVGCVENLFLVNIQWYSLAPFIYKGIHRVITRMPTNENFLIDFEDRFTVINLFNNLEN